MTTEASLPLLLSGPMGVGKSTVGALVAKELGRPFEDLDQTIERLAGASVTEIFAQSGEARFRELERGALLSALEKRPAQVVALGGGSLVDPVSRRIAFERAIIIGLSASRDTLLARLGESPARPLLTPDPRSDLATRIAEVLDERAEVYATSHASVQSGDATVEEVARRVVRAARDRYVPVPLASGPYAVRITSDPWGALAETLAALAPSGVFLVIDETVDALYGAHARAALVERGIRLLGQTSFPPGEQNKRLAEVERALGDLVAGGADRGTVLVAVGGGVTTDMGGFAAALFARGIRWVAVPTTLLAMVDASVGGKTGVDFHGGKNLIGAFHQPSAVLVDPALTSTETARGIRSGMAELVKALALGDAERFEACERAMVGEGASVHPWQWELPRLSRALTASIRVKASIVAKDPGEKGIRAVLNFGHTLGHALESMGQLSELTHGEAVAMGMVAACRIGTALGVTPPSVGARLASLLEKLGLPTIPPPGALEAALPWVHMDKKRAASSVRFILLENLGHPVVRSVSVVELARLIKEVSG